MWQLIILVAMVAWLVAFVGLFSYIVIRAWRLGRS
jgi:hypothetical protein